jgi:hypothetical protein
MFLKLLTLIAIKLVECFLHPTKTAIRTATYAQSFLLFCIKDAPAIMTTTSTHAQNLLLPSVQDDPAITMTNHAEYSLQLIVESLFLLRDKDKSETMASSLLLFCVKDAPAIMMVTHADYSLQLIVESLFTGAKQVASATIPNESFKLIDVSKTSLHFREDCGMFCEGEWEQKRRFNGHTGIVGLGLISHPDLARLTGLVGFIGLINFIGLIGLISVDNLRWLVSLARSLVNQPYQPRQRLQPRRPQIR